MLGLGDTPDKACSVVVIPWNEGYGALCDNDRDGSDIKYERDTGLLPDRVLNEYVELIQTDHDRHNVISDDDLPQTSILDLWNDEEACVTANSIVTVATNTEERYTEISVNR